MGLVPTKKLGQNAPSQVHHTSKTGNNMGVTQGISNALQF
jgi:hypothetical protein